MRLIAIGDDSPAVLSIGPVASGIVAFGVKANGIIAVGALATGFVAIGQLATGVIAIGQLARGVIVVGQLALGVAAVGQFAVGVVYSAGVGVAPFAGPGLIFGLFGKLNRDRVHAWLHRVAPPWGVQDQVPVQDRIPVRPWRVVAGVLGTVAIAVGWWYASGIPQL
jgi:hypothetical protein